MTVTNSTTADCTKYVAYHPLTHQFIYCCNGFVIGDAPSHVLATERLNAYVSDLPQWQVTTDRTDFTPDVMQQVKTHKESPAIPHNPSIPNSICYQLGNLHLVLDGQTLFVSGMGQDLKLHVRDAYMLMIFFQLDSVIAFINHAECADQQASYDGALQERMSLDQLIYTAE